MKPSPLAAFTVITLAMTVGTGAAGRGSPRAVPAPAAPSPNAALAAALRGLLVEALPNPLYEGSKDWGKTARVRVGYEWKGKGLHGHFEPRYADRYHGTWRKARVTPLDLPHSLVLDVRDLNHPEPGRTTFTLGLAFVARAELEQQKWSKGTRIYGNNVRARLRVKLALQCECTTRLESGKGWFPDAVFRLRVLKADLGYDDVVVEHLAGVGGTTAKVMGELVLRHLKRWHPSLERRLLERANAAIVKAGDTKEVRVGLGKLLSGTGHAPARK